MIFPDVSEVSISDKHVSEASSITARPLPNDSTINTQFTENIARDSDNKVITLPANLQNIISALTLTWLLYGVFSILKVLHAVRQLNRMANAMPVVNRSDLNELLSKYLPHSNNIARLRVSRDLNSPFVCPNGVICMPSWALEQSNQALCLAMLHHEIQHIIRRDGAWRIAHEFIKNVLVRRRHSNGSSCGKNLVSKGRGTRISESTRIHENVCGARKAPA
ncbi:hypothetical protein H8K33_18070 [Undibacterium amnicola]|uniref:Peptidase M56 domain-containing protein n=1 Tax=Undibacterium amnicola TaxID=1834038 RepID=A0ABR6XVM9_9BURK|nr:hypothetical protein [Undibacterium amnicola]